jgi:hypothetical protein
MTVSELFHNVPNSGNYKYIVSQADLVFLVTFYHPPPHLLNVCYYFSPRWVVMRSWCKVADSGGVACRGVRTTVVSVDSRRYEFMPIVGIGAYLLQRLLESANKPFTASVCLRVGWGCYVKLDLLSMHHFLNLFDVKYGPLSVMILSYFPNILIASWMKCIATSAFICIVGKTVTALLKWSIPTKQYA